TVSGSTSDTTGATASTDTSTSSTDASGGSDLVPIAFIHPVAPDMLTFRGSCDGTIVKHNGEARITEQEPGIFVLRSGEILVSAAEATTIKLGSHKVRVSAGSVTLVGMSEGSISIRTLWDRRKNSVSATVKGQTLPIPVGHEMVVAVDDS